MFINDVNSDASRRFLKSVIDCCINFKLQRETIVKSISNTAVDDILEKIPEDGENLDVILNEFKQKIMPYCMNFSSPYFMGFPDSGNSTAAMGGAIFAELLQQNLINQRFCSPSATFVEIAVIRWLREAVGYVNPERIESAYDAGGIITNGGTMSNSIAMLLAKKRYLRLKRGNRNSIVLIPRDIGHYSIRSALDWIGFGKVAYLNIVNNKIDLIDLENKLKKYGNRIMCIVAYAGDSRTMTIDELDKIAELVRQYDKNAWLHADACHGFSLGFSEKYKHLIKGIEKFDSISTDPHKVLCTPYTISALLLKCPEDVNLISTSSDLITKEPYALGQTTPFCGSKNWCSLKLWFLIKNMGQKGISDLIEQRILVAEYFKQKLRNDESFIVLGSNVNVVLFMLKNKKGNVSLSSLNELNVSIYNKICKEGLCYLHQFPYVDHEGIISKGQTVYPLRFMSGNPNLKYDHIDEIYEYLKNISSKVESENC